MFYDDRDSILRILAIAPLAYASLVLLLRVSGKRTLSKMNAFDLVVTIALGSLLATVILDDSVSLVGGIAAFSVIVAAQLVVTWLSVRSTTVERLVKADPTLLYHDGRYLRRAMRRARVTEREIEAAARLAGVPSMRSVEAVILETDSTVAVLQARQGAEAGDGSDSDSVGDLWAR